MRQDDRSGEVTRWGKTEIAGRIGRASGDYRVGLQRSRSDLNGHRRSPPERSGAASSIPGYRVPPALLRASYTNCQTRSNCSRLSNSPGSRTHSPLRLVSVAFQTSVLCPRSRPVRPPDRRDTRSRCIDRHGAFGRTGGPRPPTAPHRSSQEESQRVPSVEPWPSCRVAAVPSRRSSS
jgi:hypothetical protein